MGIQTTTPGPVVTSTTPFVKTTTTPVKPIGGTSTVVGPTTSTGTIGGTTSPVVVVPTTCTSVTKTPGSKTTGVTTTAGPGKTSTPTTKTTKTPSGGVIKSTATPASLISCTSILTSPFNTNTLNTNGGNVKTLASGYIQSSLTNSGNQKTSKGPAPSTSSIIIAPIKTTPEILVIVPTTVSLSLSK